MSDSGMDSGPAHARNVDTRNMDTSAGDTTDTPPAPNMDDLIEGLSGSLDAVSREETPQELRFGFSHRGFYFIAKARRGENGEARLSLCGSIGFLPYSVQSAFVRRCVLYLTDEKRRPALGQFLVQPNKRIIFLAETGISPDMGHEAVIAGLCQILFNTKPHLDLMAECLAFVPLSEGAGEPPSSIASGGQSPAPQLPRSKESSDEDSGGDSGKKTAAISEEKPADEKKTTMKKVLSKVKAKDKKGLQVKKRKKPATKAKAKAKKTGAAQKTAKKAAKKTKPKKATKKPKSKAAKKPKPKKDS